MDDINKNKNIGFLHLLEKHVWTTVTDDHCLPSHPVRMRVCCWGVKLGVWFTTILKVHFIKSNDVFVSIPNCCVQTTVTDSQLSLIVWMDVGYFTSDIFKTRAISTIVYRCEITGLKPLTTTGKVRSIW